MWDLKKFGESTALISESGEIITYSELEERLEKVRIHDKKSLVFILCQNSIECVTFYLSCLSFGMVPFMLDSEILQDKFKKLLQAYQPAYCYIPKIVRKIVSTGYHYVRGDKDYCLYEKEEKTAYDIYEELALLLSTSGTTGSAKAVRQSYTNIESNAKAICEYLHITGEERAVLTLPVYYTYGLSVLHSHLLAGAAVLLTRQSVLQKEFWRFVQKYRATSLSGVPYMYELLRKVKFAEMKLPDLHYMTQAGGALGEPEWEYMEKYSEKRKISFYVMYGQTEATARISYLPPDKMSEKRGSVGVAIPGSEIRIEEGEVVCRGENVCLGYAESFSDLNKKDEWDGVLYTGDMGYLDDEGYLYIQGRKDRCIKLLGKRINLDELQNYLSKRIGKELYAISGQNKIELVSQNVIVEEKLIHCLRELKIPMSYVTVRLLSQIPRKKMGKVDYEKLQKTE